MESLKTTSNNTEENKTASDQRKETLSVVDNRNGKKYQIPIKHNTIKATDIQKIRSPSGAVLRSYDPGYMNTVNCTSRISFIDGEKGILQYRGYAIEQLAEKSTFLQVAFLLINGELPTKSQFAVFQDKIMTHTFYHNQINRMMKSYRYDAHPMGQLIATIAALSTFHPEANPALAGQSVYENKKLRNKQIYRILGTCPTMAANAYRHRMGRPYNMPAKGVSYVENFLYMLDNLNDVKFKPHPKLVKALDILFILHAEHELNCSTAAVRHLSSSQVDIYSCIAGSAAALYGPRHGGANQAVLRMLESIGDIKNIPKFIQDVKSRKQKLMGFGHRVYKNYDPRARIVKKVADEVFEILGKEPLIEIAVELEKIALTDEFFIKRKLYPNVDFYSGVIYKAMGFPTDMFPILFTIPRIAGWLAHWNQFQDDPENRIVRPRQTYLGQRNRKFVPMEDRQEAKSYELEATTLQSQMRRQVAIEYAKKTKAPRPKL